MVEETRAVEGNFADPGGNRTLGDDAADGGGSRLVLGAAEAVAHVLLQGGRRGDHLVTGRGDDLGVQVLARAVHRQARHAEAADVHAGALGATQAADLLFHG